MCAVHYSTAAVRPRLPFYNIKHAFTGYEVGVGGSATSIHSFTHMYREKATYSQRNHTSCDLCICIALSAPM